MKKNIFHLSFKNKKQVKKSKKRLNPLILLYKCQLNLKKSVFINLEVIVSSPVR